MKKSKLLIIVAILVTYSVGAQEWVYNIDEAKKQASLEEKSIVLVFAGSDWCAPCIKLERKIWESEEFQKLSRNSFVMLKADFPRKKKNKLTKEQQKHNDKLAEKYNKYGNFPLVVVLDAQGNVKGKVGYENISPKEYYQKLKSLSNE